MISTIDILYANGQMQFLYTGSSGFQVTFTSTIAYVSFTACFSSDPYNI